MLVETDVCFYWKDGNSFVSTFIQSVNKIQKFRTANNDSHHYYSTTGYFLNQPINELDYLVTEMAITKSQRF